MKVVIVIPSLTIGGAEKQALEYAKVIKKKGWTPEIIGLGKESGLKELLNKEEVYSATFPVSVANFFSKSRIKQLKFLISFLFYLRKRKPDVLISFTYTANVCCSVIKPFLPLNVYFWNQRSVENNPNMTFWEKVASLSKKEYLGNSRHALEKVIKRHKKTHQQGTFIPNFIDYNLSPKKQDTSDTNQAVIRFIKIANFYPEKDYLTVLKGFKLLKEKHPNLNFQLDIIGKAPGISPSKDIIKARVLDYKLFNNVRFIESQSFDKDNLLNYDVGILSSFSEGCSNSLLEYMAYGLSVIASNIDANTEILSNDKSQLFELENEHSCYNLILKNISNDYRIENSKLNRKIIKQYFNNHETEKQLIKLIGQYS